MSRRLALLDKAADELEHGKSTFNWNGGRLGNASGPRRTSGSQSKASGWASPPSRATMIYASRAREAGASCAVRGASEGQRFWTPTATQREQRRFWSPGRSRRDAVPEPSLSREIAVRSGLPLEFVQEAHAHVDPCACGAMLVQVGVAAGLIQQRLDPAHAEEFDAKDPAEIPEDN